MQLNSFDKNARSVCIKSIKIWNRIEKECLIHNPSTKGLILFEVRYILQEELNISDKEWVDKGRKYLHQVVYELYELSTFNKNNDFKISLPNHFNMSLIKHIIENYPDSIF